MTRSVSGRGRRKFGRTLLAWTVAVQAATALGQTIASAPSTAVTEVTTPGKPIHVRPEATPPVVSDDQIPLAWWNVVVLVNTDSPASLEVVKMYRQYHPQIRDEQIIYLNGLPDCGSPAATPADEIITRTQFEMLIAEPTRAHLIAQGLVDQVYVIITTAGMPYRIEDTNPSFDSVIKPNGSNGSLAVPNRHAINAASVESELAGLFLIDPTAPTISQMPIAGRIVNPYLGYATPIKRWANDRAMLSRRDTFRWTYMWRTALSPKIEGDFDAAGYSAFNRRMSPADLYLVARLDGPHPAGKYPVFAVKRMLERAARASDPQHARFAGFNPLTAFVAIDGVTRPPAPDVFAWTDIYNVPVGIDLLTFSEYPIPPGAEVITARFSTNHYFQLFKFLTGFDATAGGTGSRTIDGYLGGVALWDDSATVLTSAFEPAGGGVIGVLTYGRNGGEGRPVDYVLTSGPGGGPLFNCAPGAMFTSLESFNAVTFFSNAATGQAKIGDFIEIGGTAAAGHAFEPEVTAAFQGEFLYANLMRDEDLDGVSDLTLVEAVFTAMPFISWAEVLIGDPLMRLHAGPGAVVDIAYYPGDVTGDRVVSYEDALRVLEAYGSSLGGAFYDVSADVSEDGVVDDADLAEVMSHYGTIY